MKLLVSFLLGIAFGASVVTAISSRYQFQFTKRGPVDVVYRADHWTGKVVDVEPEAAMAIK